MPHLRKRSKSSGRQLGGQRRQKPRPGKRLKNRSKSRPERKQIKRIVRQVRSRSPRSPRAPRSPRSPRAPEPVRSIRNRDVDFAPLQNAPMRRPGGRLSARWYYDHYNGNDAVGDVCDIRGDGEMKCLIKRSNGSPFWADLTENNMKKYKECEGGRSKCKV